MALTAKFLVRTDRPLLIPLAKESLKEAQEFGIADKLLPYHQLYQIQALRDFICCNGEKVKTGQFGGFIETPANLDLFDNSWIDENVKVYQFARVSMDMLIKGSAFIRGLYKSDDVAVWQVGSQDSWIVNHQYIYSTMMKRFLAKTDGVFDRNYFLRYVEFFNALGDSVAPYVKWSHF